MNRVIKFRGKAIEPSLGWIYGDLIQLSEVLPVIQRYEGQMLVGGEECKRFSQDKVHPETVGQFTGLHDKNGKEIYECDVLKNNLSDNPFGVVTWHNDGYFFIDCGFGKFPINANGYNPLGKMLVLKIDNVKDVFFEVIGNIHDNPELLKGGKNE